MHKIFLNEAFFLIGFCKMVSFSSLIKLLKKVGGAEILEMA